MSQVIIIAIAKMDLIPIFPIVMTFVIAVCEQALGGNKTLGDSNADVQCEWPLCFARTKQLHLQRLTKWVLFFSVELSTLRQRSWIGHVNTV